MRCFFVFLNLLSFIKHSIVEKELKKFHLQRNYIFIVLKL